MADKSGFYFKVLFLDDDGLLIDTDGVDILVDSTDNPEHDADKAYDQADDWAEKHMPQYSAEDFEIHLSNAY